MFRFSAFILVLFLANVTLSQETNPDFSKLTIDPEIFDNYQIIGLGEESHGIKSINQGRNWVAGEILKHFSVKFVVLEESMPRVYAINREINKAHPDYLKALKAVSRFWQTQETKELFELIHNHNIQDPEHPLILLGMDLGSHYALYQEIKRFFTVMENNAEDLEKYSRYEKDFKAYKKLNKPTKRKIMYIIQHLTDDLANHGEEYRQKYSDIEIEMMHLLLKNATYRLEPNPKIREVIMFNNVMDIYKSGHNNEKVILYAHNEHISKKSYETTMGEMLGNQQDINYYALGFEFGEGDYLAYDSNASTARILLVGVFAPRKVQYLSHLQSNHLDFYEGAKTLKYLHEHGEKVQFYHLSSLSPSSELYQLLHTSQPYHNIGVRAAMVDRALTPKIWSERYEGIFYIDVVEASEVLTRKGGE